MNFGQVFPEQYEAQLAEKAERLQALMKPFDPPPLEVHDSPREGYRMRAEFRIWHEGDDLFYAMFEPGNKRKPVRIDACPMVSEPIQRVMFPLLERVRASEELRRKLFQIDFLSATTGELLVTLIYHRPIGEGWQAEAAELGRALGVRLIGRARKTRIVLDEDWIEERFEVDGRSWRYQQVENSFTQPNAAINRKMLAWATEVTRGVGGDLLELYCGNGNFTLPLSRNFERVLATEIGKRSVTSALHNLAVNEVDNVTVLRLSSEEFTEAMNGTRHFRRLEGGKLADYNFQCVLVDPPRAGLDAGTEALVQRFPRILYISCNPQTQAENLRRLCQTHRIERFALFDQFPYTEHCESGVWLVRR